MIDCLISFGSNLGNSRQIILDAVESLESGHPVFNLRISEFLITPPVGGPPGQPDFINGAARFDTNLTPLELLGLLHQTETDFGRERRIRWDSRTLDLDLLLYGNRILAENDCEIPHPRMSFRQFVLVPAQSIAAEMIHPVSRCSIGSLLERIQVGTRVLLLTERSRLDEIAKRFSDFPGNCQMETGCLDQWKDLVSETSPARLLILDLTCQDPQEFLAQHPELVPRHRGPLLVLHGQPVQQVVLEISAAMEAMKAIR